MQANIQWLADPTVFKINRLDAHSDHIWYRDEAEMKAKSSSFRYDLNGLWKFAYAPNYASVIKGFEAVDYDCKSWTDIRVPAHLQLPCH